MWALALWPSLHLEAVEAQTMRASFEVVEYDAPRGCPSRRQFERRVADRLIASGSSPRRPARVRVALWTGTGSARGTLTIEAGASRSLEGASCKEVVEGLALITALALTQEPGEGGRDREGDRQGADAARSGADAGALAARNGSGSSGTDESPRLEAASTEAEAARGGAAPARDASDDTKSPAQSVTTDRRAPAAEGGDADAADTAVDSHPLEPEPEPDSSPSPGAHLRLGASLLAFHGIAPQLRPGLQLTAALVQPLQSLELSVQLAGRLALPQTLDTAFGKAHFGFVAGAIALCAAPRLGRTGLSLRGCGVAEPGALSWSGTQTEEARAFTRAWLALGPAAALWWRGTWLGLGLGAELLWPVRRDRAVLAGEVLQRVPSACLRLQIGLELSFGAGP